jgi:hypothetical protein
MNKTDFCKYADKEVTVKWNEKQTGDGLRITGRHCPEVGKGGCPVHGVAGNRNFSECPLIPASRFDSHA